MLRHVLALVTMAALIGCESQSSVSRLGERPPAGDQARLAAFSAQLDFPQNVQASDDLQASAIVNTKDKTITINNFSDHLLQNARVWVNGQFVREVESIPAHGSLTIHQAQFYNKMGQNLATGDISVQRVQVQSGNNLYSLQGPQYQTR